MSRKVHLEMAISIKNEETDALIRELAHLTGQSQTAAVTTAVREQLARVRQQQGSNLADRLLTIGKDCAAHVHEPYLSVDHGDMLYDDDGLPR